LVSPAHVHRHVDALPLADAHGLLCRLALLPVRGAALAVQLGSLRDDAALEQDLLHALRVPDERRGHRALFVCRHGHLHGRHAHAGHDVVRREAEGVGVVSFARNDDHAGLVFLVARAGGVTSSMFSPPAIQVEQNE